MMYNVVQRIHWIGRIDLRRLDEQHVGDVRGRTIRQTHVLLWFGVDRQVEAQAPGVGSMSQVGSLSLQTTLCFGIPFLVTDTTRPALNSLMQSVFDFMPVPPGMLVEKASTNGERVLTLPQISLPTGSG